MKNVAKLIASKHSMKSQNIHNQSSNLMSPLNGSANTSMIIKKDNKIKIKIENVVQKNIGKKSNVQAKKIIENNKNNDNMILNNNNINHNNYLNFEKIFDENEDKIKNSKAKPRKKSPNININTNTINSEIFSINKNDIKPNLLPLQTNSDLIDNINEEWIMSPMNKINVKSSKLISEKPKNEISYLKIDKSIVKNHGCCQACV